MVLHWGKSFPDAPLQVDVGKDKEYDKDGDYADDDCVG
jgi:hypothetical protein